MQEIELSAGIIEYIDTGGSGPVVVMLPGAAMDGSLWRHVVRALHNDHRCVVPTLPLGGHRLPMRAYADLSPRGIARLEVEFLFSIVHANRDVIPLSPTFRSFDWQDEKCIVRWAKDALNISLSTEIWRR